MPDKVILWMIDYIRKILDNIPEDVKGESATPAEHHLFDIAEYATKLSRADEDHFHNFLAQLLYISNKAHPYIRLEISFLFNRVRGPDTEDHKNLVRVMKYTQVTIVLPLILSIEKTGNVKWYVDAAFAVQKYMRSPTGGLMTMGTVGAYVH